MSISDEILKSIEIALSNIEDDCDRTYQGVVKEIITNYKYKIEYDGAERIITTKNKLSLSVGDSVHVMCPRNNIMKNFLLEDLSVTTNNVGSSSGDGSTTIVQADWKETDPKDSSYIKNKPSIPSTASDLDAYTKEEVDNIISNLNINPDDIDLSDYVDKDTLDTILSDYSTKEETNNAITTALSGIKSNNDVEFKVKEDGSVWMVFNNY